MIIQVDKYLTSKEYILLRFYINNLITKTYEITMALIVFPNHHQVSSEIYLFHLFINILIPSTLCTLIMHLYFHDDDTHLG